LNEAVAETYLPLLRMLHRLRGEGPLPKLVLSLTPVLLEQLAHPSFKDGFKHYLNLRIEAARKDQAEFRRLREDKLLGLALFWESFYVQVLRDFITLWDQDLVGAFRDLQRQGAIEIMTSAATHGYLPLIGRDWAIELQLRVGIESYRRYFDGSPSGIWLPECGYRPAYRWSYPLGSRGEERWRRGIEEFLFAEGLRYFIIDNHLLRGGRAIGQYLERFKGLRELWHRFEEEYGERVVEGERSPYRPYLVSSEGSVERAVAVFARDPKTTVQVWSRGIGYPGDPHYLEFHKKRWPSGLRYWRVTSPQSDLGEKELYEPAVAEARSALHAEHFVNLIGGILEEEGRGQGLPPIIVAPFDAELFGHWWFEGVHWLYQVLKRISASQQIGLITTSEYLDRYPPSQIISLPEGSWGEGGYHWIWFNDWTQWTWRYIYEAERDLEQLLKGIGPRPEGDLRAVVEQLIRELLLLQSSDWQFLISTWTARDYAEGRLLQHYQSFQRLLNMGQRLLKGGELDPADREFLQDCQQRDSLFPSLPWPQVQG